MKVDLVIGTLNRGGAERQLVGLATSLRAIGVDVQVVTLIGDGPLQSYLEEAGVTVVELAGSDGRPQDPARFISGVVWRLARYWRQRRPEAVQVWLPREQSMALPVARALGIPVRVMAIRSLTSSVRLSRLREVALRLAAESSTCVIANSAAALGDPNWPISKLPAFVVGNGVDPLSGAIDVARMPPRAVVVANLHQYKGHLDLLEALASLRDPLRVDLIGSGPLHDDIDAHIRRLGLGHSVSLLGSVAKVSEYYQRSQFAILPSLSEGLPNVVLEAMAAGLPVVAYASGGVPEVIEDGQSGLLVPTGDVDGLARAIDFVAHNPQWRLSAGAKGRAIASSMTWEVLAHRNLEIMEAALRARRSPDRLR